MPAESRQRQAERRLFAAYRATGEGRARDAVIEHFLPLARSLARRYQGRTEPLEDLEQVACLALVRAVDSFDPSRGTAFSSYAVPSIVGAIKRHYRDYGWAVRVPRELQELALRIERLAEATDAGRSPTAHEIAEITRFSVEEVLEAREAARALYSESIDQPRGRPDPDAPTLLDTLGDCDYDLVFTEERLTQEAWLETLDMRERAIVTLYYRNGLTQTEIGRRLGYSQMHISRLLRQALTRLRDAADEQERAVAARLSAA